MSRQTTLNFIQQDIAEVEREIAQIDEQTKFLVGKREALAFKLKLLQKGAKELPNAAFVPATEDKNKAAFSHSLAGSGMTEAIRIILSQSKGLRPRDVASELTRRGFRYEAATDLSTRISNELFRMKKSGQVKRRGSLYSMAKPQEVNNDN